MGNVPTKEARPNDGSAKYATRRSRSASAPSKPLSRHKNDDDASSSSSSSSPLSSGSKSKIAALETVDGGFLIPQGVYPGPQDYKHKVVRHLMIDRYLAPFYKGLADYDECWSDDQLIAALCGMNPASVITEESETEVQSEAQKALALQQSQNQSQLSTPTSPSTRESHESHESRDSHDSCSSHQTSATSASSISNDNNSNLGEESVGSDTASSPTEPTTPAQPETTTTIPLSRELKSYVSTNPNNPFRRDLHPPMSVAPCVGIAESPAATATATISNPRPLQKKSSADSVKSRPKKSPFIASVYRGAVECPICFLYYPKHINKTRCCMQPICSECFVQIKRPDPHLPYHTGEEVSQQDNSSASELVSEPANCPYCAQSQFAVTYTPGDTRSGVVPLSLKGMLTTSTSSSSSSTSSKQAPPMVVTTDMVRPDWQAKLDKARQAQAKRAANAAALHASNLILAPGESSSSTPRERRRRSHGSHSSSSRSNRHRSESHSHGSSSQRSRRFTTTGAPQEEQPRLSELEDMMIVEAIRRSLQTVEDERERQKKPTVSSAVLRPTSNSGTPAAATGTTTIS